MSRVYISGTKEAVRTKHVELHQAIFPPEQTDSARLEMLADDDSSIHYDIPFSVKEKKGYDVDLQEPILPKKTQELGKEPVRTGEINDERANVEGTETDATISEEIKHNEATTSE